MIDAVPRRGKGTGMQGFFRGAAILFLLVLLAFNHACFKQIVETREPLPDIIWPRPPEIPRIRLINSLSVPEDVNIRESGLTRFLRFLKGETRTSLVTPYGVVTDSDGRLYIVDTFLRLVHVYDRKRGTYYTFPGEKTSFVSPIGIAADSRGTLYVSDSKEAVLKVFRDGGKQYMGELGRGILERPTGVAYNRVTNELLVVDTEGSQVIRYNADTGTVKGIIGAEGTISRFFYKPTNICATTEGNIVVSDSLNFRIQVLSPTGEFISAFGSAGDGPGYFSRPRGVAVDSDDNIYVVDAIFDNVQVFNKEGSLLMAFGSPGSEYGSFWLPSGIFIDSEDRIYVSDSYNHRVQVFKYMKHGELIE